MNLYGISNVSKRAETVDRHPRLSCVIDAAKLKDLFVIGSAREAPGTDTRLVIFGGYHSISRASSYHAKEIPVEVDDRHVIVMPSPARASISGLDYRCGGRQGQLRFFNQATYGPILDVIAGPALRQPWQARVHLVGVELFESRFPDCFSSGRSRVIGNSTPKPEAVSYIWVSRWIPPSYPGTVYAALQHPINSLIACLCSASLIHRLPYN
ncbi:uncharacterized protein B0H64DRAFT_130451 [Chaetomium fimeti]|uniref:Uncharacterized protein n=1 Tax=Chaetomium fimeti TaxID=1854472 RepID=A0AAE0HJK7_9PEZI|nr:hypothetical protein B0H64DRAFT_130451 [Chaetomium fimeti]